MLLKPAFPSHLFHGVHFQTLGGKNTVKTQRSQLCQVELPAQDGFFLLPSCDGLVTSTVIKAQVPQVVYWSLVPSRLPGTKWNGENL